MRDRSNYYMNMGAYFDFVGASSCGCEKKKVISLNPRGFTNRPQGSALLTMWAGSKQDITVNNYGSRCDFSQHRFRLAYGFMLIANLRRIIEIQTVSDYHSTLDDEGSRGQRRRKTFRGGNATLFGYFGFVWKSRPFVWGVKAATPDSQLQRRCGCFSHTEGSRWHTQLQVLSVTNL